MQFVRRPVVVAMLLSLVIGFAFLRWYEGGREPLSDAEIAAFLSKIDVMPEPHRTFLSSLDLESFMRHDDRKAFYVINLFRLKPTVDLEGLPDTGMSGQAALNRFTRALLPLWLRHAGHPVFSMAGIREPAGADWDFVSVVRYRSRRDFMEVVLDDLYQQSLPFRLAATESNLRIASVGTEFPRPFALLLLCTMIVLALAYVVERRIHRDRFDRSATDPRNVA